MIPTYLVFGESDSKLYTNFELCEERNHRHFKNMMVYKTKQIMVTKKIQENLNILEDDASGVQVGDVEQVVV